VSALAERFTVVAEPRTLDARGRLEALFDPGSLNVIRSTVLPPRSGGRSTPGDGVVGGAIRSRSASSVAIASTAPAAPRRWPIADLVELTGICAARSSPNAALIALVSERSLSGVEVPWALM